MLLKIRVRFIFRAVIVCLIAICGGASWATEPTSSPVIDPLDRDAMIKVGTWMMEYYKHPSPDQVSEQMTTLATLHMLSDGNHVESTSAFFARIFVANPDRIVGWGKDIDALPPNEQKTLWQAMAWAHSDNCVKELKSRAEDAGPRGKFMNRVLGNPALDLKSTTRPSPDDLDACWASFFASGDKDYVGVVIKCAISDARPGEDGSLTMLDMSPEAARWSTRSLCEQNEDIRNAVIAYRDHKASPQERPKVDALLNMPAQADSTQPTSQPDSRK